MRFRRISFPISAILIYLWFRFEWQFSLGAMIANVHDLVLTIGYMSLTQIDFDLSSIAALLTILGYSLNDTVVIYDRIREMLRRYKRMSMPDLLNISVNSTLSRSIITHVTVTLALLALLLFGGVDIGALSHHAGLAHAFAGLLAAFPIHAARGKVFVPLDVLARHGAAREDAVAGQATPQLHAALAELRLHARGHLRVAERLLAAAPPAVVPALLPVALVGPTLVRMERRDYDPFRPIEIAPWRRQLRIWRAARWPRRIFRLA